jgi:hypothetical protein
MSHPGWSALLPDAFRLGAPTFIIAIGESATGLQDSLHSRHFLCCVQRGMAKVCVLAVPSCMRRLCPVECGRNDSCMA